MKSALQLSPDDRATLLAARAVIDRLLGDEPEMGSCTTQEAPPEEPKWMKLIDYARSRQIGRRTLDRLIADGFPTKGSGHLRRVAVADADAWLERRRA